MVKCSTTVLAEELFLLKPFAIVFDEKETFIQSKSKYCEAAADRMNNHFGTVGCSSWVPTSFSSDEGTQYTVRGNQHYMYLDHSIPHRTG